MVAGTSKRCTVHEYGCPEEDCSYRTHNKKIVMTANLAKKNAEKTMATRSRVFYRDDYKKEMKNIFMSNDDQINCRFEPKTGSLNPKFWNNGPIPQKLLSTAETETEFCEKHGDNLKKTHPEVYKKGVLKKAQSLFKQGDFSKSMNTLMKAFKVKSLRQHFDPQYDERIRKQAEKKKAQEAAARAKNPATTTITKASGLSLLEEMKEDPDQVQKDMHNENFDNIKLFPILEEAYQLVQLIEKQGTDAKKKIAQLE